MRRIFGCLRINSIISRIWVRIIRISTRERQGHIYQHAMPAVRLYCRPKESDADTDTEN